MISPRITRAAYPIKRAWSGNEKPSRADMSRYASCKSVVTLRPIGFHRRASSRFAIRWSSEYKALNNASVGVLSPQTAAFSSVGNIDFNPPILVDFAGPCSKHPAQDGSKAWGSNCVNEQPRWISGSLICPELRFASSLVLSRCERALADRAAVSPRVRPFLASVDRSLSAKVRGKRKKKDRRNPQLKYPLVSAGRQHESLYTL